MCKKCEKLLNVSKDKKSKIIYKITLQFKY